MPRVSICIPTYNQTQHLTKTLESILVQTFHDYELIITDDSTNNLVGNLIQNYNFNGKLRYYRNELPLGSPQNWNYCISKANGEFIKIIHHDDWFSYEDSLAEYVNIFNGNSNIDFAYSSSHVLFQDGKNWNHTTSNEQLKKIKDQPAILFIGNSIGAPSAVIFRNKLKIGFDPKLKWLVDIDFYIRNLNENKNFGYIKKSLITTFGATGRISDFCNNNKEVEIREYFYLYDKLSSNVINDNNTMIESLVKLIDICDYYKITKIEDVRNCGYVGRINTHVSFYLFINRFSKRRGFKALSRKIILKAFKLNQLKLKASNNNKNE